MSHAKGGEKKLTRWPCAASCRGSP